MSRLLSLKLLASDKSKLAVAGITAAATTGAASNLVRHRCQDSFVMDRPMVNRLEEPDRINVDTHERIVKPQAYYNRSIAVVLSGCGGHKDGTDMCEATCTAIHVSKHRYKPAFFAPDGALRSPYDYQEREYDREARHRDDGCHRDMLNESGRLCWDEVRPLAELDHRDHMALIVPGGHGVEMNLCDYRRDGEPFLVDYQLARAMREFYEHMKPMGFISNASILAARIFEGVHVTFGWIDDCNYNLHVDARKFSAETQSRHVDEYAYCTDYKVFSTPGHICSMTTRPATYYDVCRGVGHLVDAMVAKVEPRPRRDPVPGEYRFHDWAEADLSSSIGPRPDQEILM